MCCVEWDFDLDLLSWGLGLGRLLSFGGFLVVLDRFERVV